MASLIKRGNTWYVGWREGERQRRQSLKTGDKVEAKRRLRIWQRRHDEHEWAMELDCPVDTFWEIFSAWIGDNMAAASIKSKNQYWKQFINAFHPDNLSDVSQGQVERLKQTWVRENEHVYLPLPNPWSAMAAHERSQ